jgi:hypothetical protein
MKCESPEEMQVVWVAQDIASYVLITLFPYAHIKSAEVVALLQ